MLTRLWSKLRTGARFAATARLSRRDQAIRLTMCRASRVGDFKQDVNVRSVLHVMRLLAGLGMNVFADLGPANRELWWRSRLAIEHQRCRLSPFQKYGLLVTDTDDVARDVTATWRLHYTARPLSSTDPADVVVPYGMDPSLTYLRGSAALPRSLERQRPVRVLFAGQCTREGYDRQHLIWERYGKATRYALVQHLRCRRLLHEPQTLEELRTLLASPRRKDFVFVDTHRFAIPADQWLDVVAASDFFFCPPGNIIPMCHNLVEAMAVGTIPITNYPEWLAPALTTGDTCLAFDTTESLETAIATAQDMGEGDIRAMRARAAAYYDAYLDYRAVARRLIPRLAEPLQLHVLDETFHRVLALPALHAPRADAALSAD